MKHITLPLLCFISVAFIVLSTALVISEAKFRVALSGTDFRGQYTGAHMAANGIKTDLYDTTSQFVWQKKFLPELERDSLMVYSYHPLVALALSPLGFLSFGNAYRVALALNFMLLIYVMKLSARLLNPTGKYSPFPALFAIFTFFLPVWFALLQNQFSYVMYVMFFFLWKCIKEGKNFKAGLLLSVFIIKPHMIIVPLIVFTIVRNWDLIKGFLIGITAVTIATFLFFGAQTIKNYFSFLVLLSKAGDLFTIHTADEPTIKGFIHAILHTDKLPIAATIIYLLVFVAFIARLIYLKKFADKDNKRFDMWFCVVILATLLTSPHTNYHDLTLILFAGFMLLRYFLSKPAYKHVYDFHKRRKLTFYLLNFGIFAITASWVFYPPIATLSMFVLFMAIDYVIRTGHLYAFTKKSISRRK